MKETFFSKNIIVPIGFIIYLFLNILKELKWALYKLILIKFYHPKAPFVIAWIKINKLLSFAKITTFVSEKSQPW